MLCLIVSLFGAGLLAGNYLVRARGFIRADSEFSL